MTRPGFAHTRDMQRSHASLAIMRRDAGSQPRVLPALPQPALLSDRLISVAKTRWLRMLGCALLVCGLGIGASAQSAADQTTAVKQKKARKEKSQPSPGRQVANGTGNIAGGAAKGAGDAAKGVGKGAADLATLHPVDAAGSVGKGVAGAGKDAGVGAAKGSGKVVKGIGRGIKHLF
jgi:hypothetical protein